jgi:hypothetical protein
VVRSGGRWFGYGDHSWFGYRDTIYISTYHGHVVAGHHLGDRWTALGQLSRDAPGFGQAALQGWLRCCRYCIVSGMTVGSSPPAPKRKRALSPQFTANIWRPGQSGNPAGHSGLYGEAVSLARQAAPAAVRRLIELMGSADERVASVAANAILDRAFGKPRDYDPTAEGASPKSTFDPRRYSAEQVAQIEKALRIVVEVQGPGAHPQTAAGR